VIGGGGRWSSLMPVRGIVSLPPSSESNTTESAFSSTTLPVKRSPFVPIRMSARPGTTTAQSARTRLEQQRIEETGNMVPGFRVQ
jgi:hypothetical protein